MMPGLWLSVAAGIEFIGAVIILAAALQAIRLIASRCPAGIVKAAVARGVVAALDFKMGATLLKSLSLTDWHYIGKFAAILLLRVILKSSAKRAAQAGREAAVPAASP